MDPGLHFQPCQIVCMQHETHCLYAEVVQTVELRQLCWVRPLALTIQSSYSSNPLDEGAIAPSCYDLRNGADLLWPLILFRAALDTELTPLLPLLYGPSNSAHTSQPSNDGHRHLRQFIQQVWQAYPEVF